MLNMRTLLPQPSRAAFATNIITAPWTYNTQHTADANTIVLYHFEENAANANYTDSSANGYTGTASANTSVLYNAGGQFNGCAYVNKLYRVTLGVAGSQTAVSNAFRDKITLEGWFKSDVADWSTSGYQSFFNHIIDGNNQSSLVFDNASNRVEFNIFVRFILAVEFILIFLNYLL